MGMLDFMNVLLNLPPAISILIVSVLVSLVTTLVYKYTTDQKVMKEIKDDVKRMQAEIRSTKEPGRAAQLQKEMMGKSMRQMNSSWKSMLITMVPLFLIFGWMSSNMAYEPIMPGEEFTTTAHFEKGVQGNAHLIAQQISPLQLALVKEQLRTYGDGNIAKNNAIFIEAGNTTFDQIRAQLLNRTTLLNTTQQILDGKAVWTLSYKEEGLHLFIYTFDRGVSVLATNMTKEKKSYQQLVKGKTIPNNSNVKQITIDARPVRPFGSFSLFGWMPGWLATYLIYSIAASILTRKWLKVH